jgi:dipeptidyl aminopeptidase/acylaminoacyl peptidase
MTGPSIVPVVFFAVFANAAGDDTAPAKKPTWDLLVNRGGKVLAVAPDGSRTRPVDGIEPRDVLSPDGRQFLRRTPLGQLQLHPPGERPVVVAGDVDAYDQSFWSADGKRAGLLRKNRGGRPAILELSLTGGEPKVLAQPDAAVGQAALLPDGRVAYAPVRGREGKLTLHDVVINDGKAEKTLVRGQYIASMAFSPDGKHFACTHVDEMVVYDLDGKRVRAIRNADIPGAKEWHTNSFYWVRWRPDGGAVAVQPAFLGGRLTGTLIAGEDHVVVIPFKGDDHVVVVPLKAEPKAVKVEHGDQFIGWTAPRHHW